MQTVEAVKQLAQTIMIPRILFTFMPKVLASTSPNERMFNLQANKSKTIKQIIIRGDTKPMSVKSIVFKLPICQYTIAESSVSSLATNFIKQSIEEKKPLVIIPARTNIRLPL